MMTMKLVKSSSSNSLRSTNSPLRQQSTSLGYYKSRSLKYQALTIPRAQYVSATVVMPPFMRHHTAMFSTASYGGVNKTCEDPLLDNLVEVPGNKEYEMSQQPGGAPHIQKQQPQQQQEGSPSFASESTSESEKPTPPPHFKGHVSGNRNQHFTGSNTSDAGVDERRWNNTTKDKPGHHPRSSKQ